MNIDITQIPYADFKEDALVLLTLPEVTPEDKETVDMLVHNLRLYVSPRVQVLIMKAGMKLEVISDETLSQLGFVRKGVVPIQS